MCEKNGQQDIKVGFRDAYDERENNEKGLQALSSLVSELQMARAQRNLLRDAPLGEVDAFLGSWYERAYIGLQGFRRLLNRYREKAAADPVGYASFDDGARRCEEDGLVYARSDTRSTRPGIHTADDYCLTSREHDLLHLLASSMTVREIARHWGVSEKTVRNHLSNTYHKFGVYDRLQLVLHAKSKGLVEL